MTAFNTYWNNYFFHQLPNLTSSNAPAPTWIWVAIGVLVVSFIIWLLWE